MSLNVRARLPCIKVQALPNSTPVPAFERALTLLDLGIGVWRRGFRVFISGLKDVFNTSGNGRPLYPFSISYSPLPGRKPPRDTDAEAGLHSWSQVVVGHTC